MEHNTEARSHNHFRQIFRKSSNIIFHENPSNGRRVLSCGQTDKKKALIVFRNFLNALDNVLSKRLDARKADQVFEISRLVTKLDDRRSLWFLRYCKNYVDLNQTWRCHYRNCWVFSGVQSLNLNRKSYCLALIFSVYPDMLQSNLLTTADDWYRCLPCDITG
jgi:hypothetical protein